VTGKNQLCLPGLGFRAPIAQGLSRKTRKNNATSFLKRLRRAFWHTQQVYRICKWMQAMPAPRTDYFSVISGAGGE
jgi:hypothetical protein